MGCAASSCEHQEVSSVSADNRSDLEGTDDAPRLIVTDGISIGNITSEKPECTTESLLGHSPLQSKDASDERAACTAEALQIFGGDDSVWETDSTLEKTISLVQLNGIRIFGGGFSEDSDPLGMVESLGDSGSASASTVGSAGGVGLQGVGDTAPSGDAAAIVGVGGQLGQIRASRMLEKEQAAEATLVKFGPSIGNIGTDIQRRLFQATLGSPPDGPVCPVVERCLLNLDERPYSSAAAESNTLGIPANTFARKVILCGSGLLESSSLLWGSFCATLADRIVMKGWEPLLFVKEARYDETPSKIRVQDKSKSITSVTGAVGQSTSELNRETKTAKVLQSEIHIGALVKDPVSEEYMFFLAIFSA
ncbi:unnamed protein product [Polarella glacialis]|uniref:Uncharacterized protein n=1 Tax=Polarella glacialis TaxID=89957 RepID=A0A813FGT6_POLGL|nr:unnamed protein product [Polarella glacialis]